MHRSEAPPRESMKKADRRRERIGEIADEIEAELRRLGWWQVDPPSEDAVLAGGAFGLRSVAFPQWLQVIFVKRLRQVAAGEMDMPQSSEVSTMAYREFDGYSQDVDHLMDLLYEVDRIV